MPVRNNNFGIAFINNREGVEEAKHACSRCSVERLRESCHNNNGNNDAEGQKSK